MTYIAARPYPGRYTIPAFMFAYVLWLFLFLTIIFLGGVVFSTLGLIALDVHHDAHWRAMMPTVILGTCLGSTLFFILPAALVSGVLMALAVLFPRIAWYMVVPGIMIALSSTFLLPIQLGLMGLELNRPSWDVHKQMLDIGGRIYPFACITVAVGCFIVVRQLTKTTFERFIINL